ncbi:MAG: hypothetical protein ACYCWE_01630 [Eubacteriales bacterium]
MTDNFFLDLRIHRKKYIGSYSRLCRNGSTLLNSVVQFMNAKCPEGKTLRIREQLIGSV